MAKNERKFKVVTESTLQRFKRSLESSEGVLQAVPGGNKIIDANNFTYNVEKKAYELYVKRGFKLGRDWDDWFEAQKTVEAEMNSVDKDCIRSENFYKASHRLNPLPSDIDMQKSNISPFVNDF